MPSLQPSTLLRTDTLIDFLYVLGRISLGNTTYWALLAFFFAEWIYIFWIKKYFSKEIYIFLIFCKKSFFSKQKKNQYIFFFHIKLSFSANNVYFAKNTNIFSKKKKFFFNLVLQQMNNHTLRSWFSLSVKSRSGELAFVMRN